MEEKPNILNKAKTWLSNSSKTERFLLGLLVVSIGIFILYLSFYRSPSDFPNEQVITIESGDSLQRITNTLYEKKIISSPFIFRTMVIIMGGEKKIMAGDYLLEVKESPLTLAYRFIKGDYNLEARKVTIPEGWNIFQIADHLEEILIDFDRDEFIRLARDKEGYLFPDTYFVLPVAKPAAIINLMNNNWNAKMAKILEVYSTERDIKDIMIMASILEGEARTTESRRIISGILWKRLSIGMALQVDATFSYVNGKNTYELTLADLQIDSPYNTYKYPGLPPGPIGNPGEDSIIAAMTPINTKYLYFLSSLSGEMYYGRTFEEHKKNRELYLDK